MLPDRRYFLVHMHLKKRWVCVCDCDRWFYWYLIGYIQEVLVRKSKYKIQENAATAKVPKYIEGARKLPWTGSYINASECHLSYMVLVNAFFCMQNTWRAYNLYLIVTR